VCRSVSAAAVDAMRRHRSSRAGVRISRLYFSMLGPTVRVAAAIACLTVAGTASGQRLPEAPISAANGHVVFGAEVVATVATEDPGFFNYTDYEYNALRNVRVGLATEVRASSRLQVLAEIRLDHGDR